MSDQNPPADGPDDETPWTLPDADAVSAPEPALVGAAAEGPAGFRPGVVATGAAPNTGRAGPPKGVLRRSTISRLGPHARSVTIPAIMVLAVSLAGIGLFIAAVVAASLVIAEDGSPSRAECLERTEELQRAIEEYRADRGRNPRSLNDLVPEYTSNIATTHSVDFDAVRPTVVIFRDGPCDEEGSRTGAVVSSNNYDRGSIVLAQIVVTGGLLAVLSGLVTLPAMGLLGWWMANAYRCVTPGRRKYPVRAAYTPLTVYVVGGFFLMAVVLLALFHLVEDPLGFTMVVQGAYFLWGIAMIVAILRWLGMLAQVNHSFGRMSFAARLVRGSVIWGLAQIVVVPLGLFVAGVVSSDNPGIALAILVLLLANAVLIVVVGVVSYVVAIILATVQIERSLKVAADELTRLEQAGWLAVEAGPRRR